MSHPGRILYVDMCASCQRGIHQTCSGIAPLVNVPVPVSFPLRSSVPVPPGRTSKLPAINSPIRFLGPLYEGVCGCQSIFNEFEIVWQTNNG